MKYFKNTKIILSALILGIFILGAVPAPASSAIYLKNINVQKAGDSVVVVITSSAAGDFNAFVTEGKPERIVVDLDGAINAWSTKKFTTLPCKSISSVRTSQFKPNPSPVTRVVLDIGRPINFRSYKSGNDIIIKLPAATGETEFAAWDAQGKGTTPVPPVKAKAETKPAPVKAETVKPKKKSSDTKMASSPKREVVSYGTSKFRDPFVSLVGGVSKTFADGLPNLENLTLVGILEDIDGYRALLEDADGSGYILSQNDKIKNGYLVSVTEDKAVFQITEYGWTRTVALELELPEIR
jgi:hypothetical protein